MADPLSITASIIAVLQLSNSVVSYLQDVKDAPKKTRKLLLDIQYVQGVLDILKETVQTVKTATEWNDTIQVLNRSGNPIEVLQNVLLGLETKLKKASEKRGAEKLLTSILWPLGKKETEEIIRTTEKQKTLLLIALDNDHLLLSAEIKKQVSSIGKEVSQITASVQKLDTNLAAVQKGVEDVKLQESIDWLSKTTYQLTQDEIFSQRLPGSLTWFFDRPEFQTWISGSHKTLFCSGIAGAGKSVLAATVTQQLLDRFRTRTEDVGIAWIYCTFRARQLQTPVQMLASIAAQFVRQHEDLRRFITSVDRGGRTEPTEPQILAVLARCKAVFKSMYIIIDALDEYSEDTLSGWVPFIQKLKDADLGSSIFVTARPLPSIEREFTDALKIEVSAQNDDIAAYIRQRLEWTGYHKHLSNDDDLRDLIEREVVGKSQGMFLLTRLHMDALQQKAKYNKNALRKAVTQLPKKLDSTYDLTFERINAQDNDDAALAVQVLAWVYYSYEDLSIIQIQGAVACQAGDDLYDVDSLIDAELLLSVCAGLIILNPETNKVRLMHTTVAEYLDRHFHVLHPDAAFGVHRTCVKQLNDSGLLRTLMRVREYGGGSQWWWYELEDQRREFEAECKLEYERCPFSSYAEDHVRRLDVKYRISRTGFDDLHQADNLILPWCCKTTDPTTDLPLLVFLADTQRMKHLLLKDFRDREQHAETPVNLSRYLAYSILRGNDEIARLLLDAGADLQVEHVIREPRIDYIMDRDTRDCLGCAIMADDSELAALIEAKKAMHDQS